MKLFEEVAEQTNEIETLGTVGEAIGKGGEIVLDVNNLKRDDKLVMVVLKRKDGKTQTVFCSANLSAQIRKEKMAKQDLINFLGSLNITETTNEEGEKRFKIILTQGPKISGAITKAVEPQAL